MPLPTLRFRGESSRNRGKQPALVGRFHVKRVAIYARVSTSGQTTENQLLDLRRYAGERGWTVADEFVDHGVSGMKESRPRLDEMMGLARKRKIDVVLVWRFDRFARSVRHLVVALEELRALKVDFISYQENVDTSTPLGQAIFAIIAAMAELERNVIVERVHAGLSRARRQGQRLGRPRRDVDEARIAEFRREGQSLRQIAKKLGLTRTKVFNVLRTVGTAVPKPPPKSAP